MPFPNKENDMKIERANKPTVTNNNSSRRNSRSDLTAKRLSSTRGDDIDSMELIELLSDTNIMTTT